MMVEELKDDTKNNSGDDIEIALLNNDCDKVKVCPMFPMCTKFTFH